MGIAWGIVLVLLSLLCWGGQTVAWLAPATGVRLGLSEAEADVEPAFWGDLRGEARWDALTLWTTLVAGILLILGVGAWAYFGLAGGGMYVYFAGRGISTRMELVAQGQRIGSRSNVTIAFVFLAVWGVMGLVTIAAAVVALPLP